ncbi:MAG: Sec-independent protein translocase protein TatB [Dermatophilaceae bacterium]
MFDINGWELIVLVVVAIVVLGPERLPEYAGRMARGVRQLRAMAEGARAQLKEQMGPEFDDINWRQYDPRQYDPRRIVREALMEEPSPTPDKPSSAPAPSPSSRTHDPSRATPWDPEAT